MIGSFRLTAVACAALASMGAGGPAEAGTCVRLAAAGDGPTKAVAEVMSTHGLQNIIDNKGMKGQGQMKTTCAAGTFLTECHSSQTACK